MPYDSTSLTRFFQSLPVSLHPNLSRLRGVDEPDQPESSELELSLQTDPEVLRGDLLDLSLRLQVLLHSIWQWMKQEALEVDGPFPVVAGRSADFWRGRMGELEVAIKSYRSYSSSDCLLTYVVSYMYLRYMSCLLTYINSVSTKRRWSAVDSSTRTSSSLSAYILPPDTRLPSFWNSRVTSALICTSRTTRMPGDSHLCASVALSPPNLISPSRD